MFEHFTDNARHVVVGAQEIARRYDHPEITPAHFLVALRCEPEPGLAAVWDDVEALPVDLEPTLLEVLGRGSAHDVGFLPFSAAGKKVFELTLRASLSLGLAPTVTPGLLLLGVLDVADDDVTAVLRAHGVEPGALRGFVAQALS